jgi:ribosomal protein L37E
MEYQVDLVFVQGEPCTPCGWGQRAKWYFSWVGPAYQVVLVQGEPCTPCGWGWSTKYQCPLERVLKLDLTHCFITNRLFYK